jgi:hypothetical protein
VPLSWNEIRHRAIAFSKEWEDEKSEQTEKQTFWNEFFTTHCTHKKGAKEKVATRFAAITFSVESRPLQSTAFRARDISNAPSLPVL